MKFDTPVKIKLATKFGAKNRNNVVMFREQYENVIKNDNIIKGVNETGYLYIYDRSIVDTKEYRDNEFSGADIKYIVGKLKSLDDIDLDNMTMLIYFDKEYIDTLGDLSKYVIDMHYYAKCHWHNNINIISDISMLKCYTMSLEALSAYHGVDVIYLDIDKRLTHLAGYRLGRSIYNEQIKDKINENNYLSIVFPDHVENIFRSFIFGLTDNIGMSYELEGLSLIGKSTKIIDSFEKHKQNDKMLVTEV